MQNQYERFQAPKPGAQANLFPQQLNPQVIPRAPHHIDPVKQHEHQDHPLVCDFDSSGEIEFKLESPPSKRRCDRDDLEESKGPSKLSSEVTEVVTESKGRGRPVGSTKKKPSVPLQPAWAPRVSQGEESKFFPHGFDFAKNVFERANAKTGRSVFKVRSETTSAVLTAFQSSKFLQIIDQAQTGPRRNLTLYAIAEIDFGDIIRLDQRMTNDKIFKQLVGKFVTATIIPHANLFNELGLQIYPSSLRAGCFVVCVAIKVSVPLQWSAHVEFACSFYSLALLYGSSADNCVTVSTWMSPGDLALGMFGPLEASLMSCRFIVQSTYITCCPDKEPDSQIYQGLNQYLQTMYESFSVSLYETAFGLQLASLESQYLYEQWKVQYSRAEAELYAIAASNFDPFEFVVNLLMQRTGDFVTKYTKVPSVFSIYLQDRNEPEFTRQAGEVLDHIRSQLETNVLLQPDVNSRIASIASKIRSDLGSGRQVLAFRSPFKQLTKDKEFLEQVQLPRLSQMSPAHLTLLFSVAFYATGLLGYKEPFKAGPGFAVNFSVPESILLTGPTECGKSFFSNVLSLGATVTQMRTNPDSFVSSRYPESSMSYHHEISFSQLFSNNVKQQSDSRSSFQVNIKNADPIDIIGKPCIVSSNDTFDNPQAQAAISKAFQSFKPILRRFMVVTTSQAFNPRQYVSDILDDRHVLFAYYKLLLLISLVIVGDDGLNGGTLHSGVISDTSVQDMVRHVLDCARRSNDVSVQFLLMIYNSRATITESMGLPLQFNNSELFTEKLQQMLAGSSKAIARSLLAVEKSERADQFSVQLNTAVAKIQACAADLGSSLWNFLHVLHDYGDANATSPLEKLRLRADLVTAICVSHCVDVADLYPALKDVLTYQIRTRLVPAKPQADFVSYSTLLAQRDMTLFGLDIRRLRQFHLDEDQRLIIDLLNSDLLCHGFSTLATFVDIMNKVGEVEVGNGDRGSLYGLCRAIYEHIFTREQARPFKKAMKEAFSKFHLGNEDPFRSPNGPVFELMITAFLLVMTSHVTNRVQQLANALNFADQLHALTLEIHACRQLFSEMLIKQALHQFNEWYFYSGLDSRRTVYRSGAFDMCNCNRDGVAMCQFYLCDLFRSDLGDFQEALLHVRGKNSAVHPLGVSVYSLSLVAGVKRFTDRIQQPIDIYAVKPYVIDLLRGRDHARQIELLVSEEDQERQPQDQQ